MNAQPLRILVVDDNTEAVRGMSLLLQGHGHSVCTAHDGETALSLAREFLPQVALLDIGLPKMDGYAVARGLRELPGLEEILLIAVTGYGKEEDRRRSQESGFAYHLVKPVDPAELEQLLVAQT